jgi:hypothetical protein
MYMRDHKEPDPRHGARDRVDELEIGHLRVGRLEVTEPGG